jgi:hypothetical protein
MLGELMKAKKLYVVVLSSVGKAQHTLIRLRILTLLE